MILGLYKLIGRSWFILTYEKPQVFRVRLVLNVVIYVPTVFVTVSSFTS